jgi:hypothetical protein
VEYKDDFGFDDEQEQGQGSEYGPVPSTQSPHTQIDTAEIKPSGTGCRTCAIFILLIGAVLGFVYFYYQNQSQNQPIPGNTPPGQMQQK